MSGKPNRLRSIGMVGQTVDRFYNELREAPAKGRMVAWCDGFPLLFPLIRAMDVDYFFGDAYAATVSARHQEKELQQIAEDKGYIVEICSYTRNTMGCALYPSEKAEEALPIWVMPKPDFIVATDPGCSMLVNWADAERRLFNVPMFVVQFHHVWYADEEKEAIADTKKQISEFITFLEDVTHRPFNWEKLKQIMTSAREATLLRKEAMGLCRAVPAPATFFDWATALGGINYALGKQECVDLYRDIRDEVAARVARKEGAVIGERYRLYWDGIACWPKLGHLANKFATMGAAVVNGRYTHLGFFSLPEQVDPEHPLDSLAINGVVGHPNRNYDWLIDNVAKLCEDYAIDGLVCHAHHTCRPLAAPQLEIMDGVSRRLGIPAVFFEADVADESYYSEAQVDTRLQALVENIEAKKRK